MKSSDNLIKEIKKLAMAENSIELKLAKEVNALSKEISRMKNMEVIQVFKNKWKFLGMSFAKGIMVGFGSVLGAAIFIYILAQLSMAPIIGDWVKKNIINANTAEEIKSGKDSILEKQNGIEKIIKYQ